MNANTSLIMFAVIAAFGLAMATVAVLPQAHASLVREHPTCENNPGTIQGHEPPHRCGGVRG
jgi:hypothetical protein